MLTALGSFLRTLRDDRNELLKDMAVKLDMSPAMLSSIETGKRNISKGFAEKVAAVYGLGEEKREALSLAIAQTKEEIAFNISGLSAADQKLAFSFARKFSDLDEDRKESIKRILSGEEG